MSLETTGNICFLMFVCINVYICMHISFSNVYMCHRFLMHLNPYVGVFTEDFSDYLQACRRQAGGN